MKNTRILLSTLILAALAATGYALAGTKKAPAADACCGDSACCASGAGCCSQ